MNEQRHAFRVEAGWSRLWPYDRLLAEDHRGCAERSWDGGLKSTNIQTLNKWLPKLKWCIYTSIEAVRDTKSASSDRKKRCRFREQGRLLDKITVYIEAARNAEMAPSDTRGVNRFSAQGRYTTTALLIGPGTIALVP